MRDMIPIQDLLHRLRWDPQFAHGEFTLGYYDRVARDLVLVPYRDIRLLPEDHFGFTVVDADGTSHSIPFHRVRVVYKSGAPIWSR
jgi:uncharacterized protein (UPF0248 family)